MANPFKVKFIKNILFYFFLSFFILEAFFVIANLFQLIRKGVPIFQSFLILPYIVPYTMPFTIPLSGLVSISIEISLMVESQELLLLESSGISSSILVKPILYFGILLALFSFYLNGKIIPAAYEQMKVSIRNSLYAYFLEGKGSHQSFEIGPNLLFCDAYGKGRFWGVHLFYRHQNQWYFVTSPFGETFLMGKDRKIFLALQEVQILELKSFQRIGKVEYLLFPLPISLGSWEREEFKTNQELIKRIHRLKLQLKQRSFQENPKKRKSFQKKLFQAKNTLVERTSFALSTFTIPFLVLGASLFFRFSHRLILILANMIMAILGFYGPFFLCRTLVEQGRISLLLGYGIPHSCAIFMAILLYSMRKG